MAGQPKTKGSFVFWFAALALSIAYIAVMVLWIRAVRDDSCSSVTFCLTAEAWGTFLQGVFAPLAFIWLVVSVQIQASELRAQRDEIEDNRRVMQEQADFIGAQTRLLERQYEDQKRERQMTDFESCLNALSDLINQRLNMHNFLTARTSSGQFEDLGVVLQRDTPRDEMILQFENGIRVSPFNRGFQEPIRFGEQYVPVAREALILCEEAIELSKKIGGISLFTASRLRLAGLRDQLERLMAEN